MKALIGKTESITYEEAKATEDKLVTEYLFYLRDIVGSVSDDEEETANIMVNMSTQLGRLLEISRLRGMLTDPDKYIAEIPYNEGVRIGDIPEEEDN